MSKKQLIINQFEANPSVKPLQIVKKLKCDLSYVYQVKKEWMQSKIHQIQQPKADSSPSRETVYKPSTQLLSSDAFKFVKSVLTREQYEGYLKGSILYGMSTNDINTASKCITELANLK